MVKYLFLIFLLYSCSKQVGPEGLLKEVINLQFSSKITKDNASKYFTEDMISSFSTEELSLVRETDELGNLKLNKFKVVLKKCTDNDCVITYLISYKTKKDSMAEVNVKKLVKLIKENEDWKIAELRNIKTHIDAKEIKIKQ